VIREGKERIKSGLSGNDKSENLETCGHKNITRNSRGGPLHILLMRILKPWKESLHRTLRSTELKIIFVLTLFLMGRTQTEGV
jgi:hypothetical protein